MEQLRQTKNRKQNTEKEGKAYELKKELEITKKELEYAMEHMEDEFSLQKIDCLVKKLEQLQPVTHEFETEKEQEIFFQQYLPMAEEMSEPIHPIQDQIKQRHIKWKKTVKIAMVFAAVFLCLNGATMVFAGMNLLETMFKWDTETFQVHTKTINQRSVAEEQIRKQVEKEIGVSIPQIMYFSGMKVEQTENLPENMAILNYSDKNQEYEYMIEILNSTTLDIFIEKTKDVPVVINVDDIAYYLIQNKNRVSIVWQQDRLLYTIIGAKDMEQANEIIKSIMYKED